MQQRLLVEVLERLLEQQRGQQQLLERERRAQTAAGRPPLPRRRSRTSFGCFFWSVCPQRTHTQQTLSATPFPLPLLSICLGHPWEV